MKKYIMLLAILATSCKSETPASILVKPFLEEYYDTGITIISEEKMDSLYCPVMIYQAILQQYNSLQKGDVEMESALYHQFLEAENGDPNMVGIKLRYRRDDRKGEVFDETFFFEEGRIKYWGLTIGLDKALISSAHSRFINAQK